MLPSTCKVWDSIIIDRDKPETGLQKARAQVKRTRITLCTSLIMGLAASAGLAQAITLDLPATAKTAATKAEALTSYALPVAAFEGGKMQTRRVEGPMTQTAWQIDVPGQTTLELLAPLRAQLVQAGYALVFECDTAECGGFDFRYGTPVLPEPEMHVDLGDFRFLSAEKGAEAVSLLVSRSSAIGFIQMTHVGGATGARPVLTASTTASTGQVALSRPIAIDKAAAPPDLGTRLSAGDAVALDDLVFASGASALSEGAYPSLVALAEWLKAHPDLQVVLVGHTDASGSLEGNIALSRKRAESVRQRMLDRYDIPGAQVDAQGVGYLAPRASNLSDGGRDQNRRVEVMMTSTPVSP